VSKRITVVGGGIIGLCSAYYLYKEGHQVMVVDQSNMDAGASYVNAGYLSPSHLIPLSAPGVMKQGLKWMFNPASPLYIKPRLNLDFLRWAWAFNRSCNNGHVEKAAPIIRDISVLSQDLMLDIKRDENLNFHYAKQGLFMLCQTEKMLEKEAAIVKMARDLGLDAKIVNNEEIKELEPNVNIEAIGGAYFECDHHTTPQEFMLELIGYLKVVGVSIRSNEKVIDLRQKGTKIDSVLTNKNEYASDEVVFTAGAWTSLLSKKLSISLLLQGGKGYRINTNRPTGITIPAILAEAKAAVTPMNGFTRFAGTMEIAGINHKINPVRVDAIARAVQRYYPDITITEEEKSEAACGLRPLSADGVPYIGRSKKCSNLTIATGHAMMGWSMSTATGKLVSEIISDKPTSLDLEPFSPDRKF
jgi:D-amino-acid dehydrogenase